MGPEIEPDLDILVGGVRRFQRREIWLWEKRIDADARALPAEVFAELLPKVQAMGVEGLLAPPGGGGPDELSTAQRARIWEEVGQHRAGVFASGYGLFDVDAPPILYAATDDQRDRFLSPLLRRQQRCFTGVADPAGAGLPTDGVRARAVWTGDRWMLDGTKIFVDGASDAAFGLVYANTEAEPGVREGVSIFVVETNRTGFQHWRPYPTLARGRDTEEINLSAVKLPPENLLGKAGDGPAFAEPLVERRRLFTAAQLTGIASAAQDMARGQVWARPEFGKPLAQGQRARLALADNEIAVRAARGLYVAAAARLDAGEGLAPDGDVARAFAGEAAEAVVDRTLQLHGPAGGSSDLPLERWARELRLRRLDHGGDEYRREAVAQYLLRMFKK